MDVLLSEIRQLFRTLHSHDEVSGTEYRFWLCALLIRVSVLTRLAIGEALSECGRIPSIRAEMGNAVTCCHTAILTASSLPSKFSPRDEAFVHWAKRTAIHAAIGVPSLIVQILHPPRTTTPGDQGGMTKTDFDAMCVEIFKIACDVGAIPRLAPPEHSSEVEEAFESHTTNTPDVSRLLASPRSIASDADASEIVHRCCAIEALLRQTLGLKLTAVDEALPQKLVDDAYANAHCTICSPVLLTSDVMAGVRVGVVIFHSGEFRPALCHRCIRTQEKLGQSAEFSKTVLPRVPLDAVEQWLSCVVVGLGREMAKENIGAAASDLGSFGQFLSVLVAR